MTKEQSFKLELTRRRAMRLDEADTPTFKPVNTEVTPRFKPINQEHAQDIGSIALSS